MAFVEFNLKDGVGQSNLAIVSAANELKVWDPQSLAALGTLNAKDFATQTTLAAVSSTLTTINGKDFATQTTLAAFAAAAATSEKQDTIIARLEAINAGSGGTVYTGFSFSSGGTGALGVSSMMFRDMATAVNQTAELTKLGAQSTTLTVGLDAGASGIWGVLSSLWNLSNTASANVGHKVTLSGTKTTAAPALGAGGAGGVGWLSQLDLDLQTFTTANATNLTNIYTRQADGTQKTMVGKVATTTITDVTNGTVDYPRMDKKSQLLARPTAVTYPAPAQVAIFKSAVYSNASTSFTTIDDNTTVPAGWSPNLIGYTVGVTVAKSTSNTLVTLRNICKDGATTLVFTTYNLVASAGTTGGTIKFTYNSVVKDNIAANTVGVTINGGAAGRITFDAGAVPGGLPRTDVITLANSGRDFYLRSAVAEIMDDTLTHAVFFQLNWAGRTWIGKTAVSRAGGSVGSPYEPPIMIPNLTDITVKVRGTHTDGVAQFTYWGTEE